MSKPQAAVIQWDFKNKIRILEFQVRGLFEFQIRYCAYVLKSVYNFVWVRGFIRKFPNSQMKLKPLQSSKVYTFSVPTINFPRNAQNAINYRLFHCNYV